MVKLSKAKFHDLYRGLNNIFNLLTFSKLYFFHIIQERLYIPQAQESTGRVIPMSFCIFLRSVRSSVSQKEIARPSIPALPVRPIR